MSRQRTTTRAIAERVFGNNLFDRAVLALGIDRTAGSQVLVELCRKVGAEPQTLTIGQFTRMLPDLGRRLRLLVPDPQAERALERVKSLVTQWNE